MRPNRAVRAALNVTVPPMALRVLRDSQKIKSGTFHQLGLLPTTEH